jgi:hypothetical protein
VPPRYDAGHQVYGLSSSCVRLVNQTKITRYTDIGHSAANTENIDLM